MSERDVMILELNNILLLLNNVDVHDEKNLNNQLSAILRIKRLKNSLEEKNENHNQQGKNV